MVGACFCCGVSSKVVTWQDTVAQALSTAAAAGTPPRRGIRLSIVGRRNNGGHAALALLVVVVVVVVFVVAGGVSGWLFLVQHIILSSQLL